LRKRKVGHKWAGIDSGLVDSPLWEGCRESTRCSRDTFPESCIAKYTSTQRKVTAVLRFLGREVRVWVRDTSVSSAAGLYSAAG